VSSGGVQGGNINLKPLIIVFIHSFWICSWIDWWWAWQGFELLVPCLPLQLGNKCQCWWACSIGHIAEGSSSCTNIITSPSCWYMALEHSDNFCRRKRNYDLALHKGIRVIPKVTCLWASFHPLSTLSVVSANLRRFNKSQYEMLILRVQCTRFETNYNSCIVRSSENICSSSGGAQEQRRDRMKLSLPPKLMVFWVSSPVEC